MALVLGKDTVAHNSYLFGVERALYHDLHSQFSSARVLHLSLTLLDRRRIRSSGMRPRSADVSGLKSFRQVY